MSRDLLYSRDRVFITTYINSSCVRISRLGRIGNNTASATTALSYSTTPLKLLTDKNLGTEIPVVVGNLD